MFSFFENNKKKFVITVLFLLFISCLFCKRRKFEYYPSVIETKLKKRVSGGRFNLYQFDEKGQKRALADRDLFALDPVRGLVRTQYFDGQAVLRRIDPLVSFTYVPLLLDKEGQRRVTRPRFTREKWEGSSGWTWSPQSVS